MGCVGKFEEIKDGTAAEGLGLQSGEEKQCKKEIKPRHEFLFTMKVNFLKQICSKDNAIFVYFIIDSSI